MHRNRYVTQNESHWFMCDFDCFCALCLPLSLFVVLCTIVEDALCDLHLLLFCHICRACCLDLVAARLFGSFLLVYVFFHHFYYLNILVVTHLVQVVCTCRFLPSFLLEMHQNVILVYLFLSFALSLSLCMIFSFYICIYYIETM